MSRRRGMRGEAPLAGARVLVTRARGEDRLRTMLEPLGATVLELPAIAIEPPRDPEPLRRAIERLTDYDWIAFTSRNAVRAVVGPLTPRGPRIAAVGPATAAELEVRGLRVDLIPDEATGVALAAALAARGVAGRRVLVPCGDLARSDLRDGLREAGARVDEVPAYRTVRPASADSGSLEALRRGKVDAVTLLSPSAVRNLAEMLDGEMDCLRRVRLVCIGPTTGAAVRELGLEPAAEAEEHTVEGLVRALIACWKGAGFHVES